MSYKQDSFFAQFMASQRNFAFQTYLLSMDGKNETFQQMHSSKVVTVTLEKLSNIPEALQEFKNHHGNGAAENIMEQIKMEEKKEGKQSYDVDRTSCKWKSENNEELAAKKGETASETGNQLIPTPQSLNGPLKSLMDVEMELVYTDEMDISFEFAQPVVSTQTQSVHRDSEKAGALSTPKIHPSPHINKHLQMTLQQASTCYRQKNYTAAVEQFSKALQICSEGGATENPFESSFEDISSIASFIETKLVICYLKLSKPDDALNHSHRSIILNPAYFRNHLRQAAVFRCLKRYSEATRSAMIADYMYWLTGGTEQHTSKLIKLYWQAMFEEAISEVSFSVMYTPFVTEVKADKISKIKDMFAKERPDYAEHIYADPRGFHILPQTAGWPSLPSQKYLLTLGFRNKHIGKILERWSTRILPIFSDRETPFSPVTEEETVRYWVNTGKKIVPVMDFIRSTKLTDDLCPCSRGIEKLHYASLLGRLHRDKEQHQVINQAMAELATVPYLQDISQQDTELLRLLMADAMDTLEGRSSDKGRVWNKIQKIGLIEDYLYQLEDNYLENKRLKRARAEKMKRTQFTQHPYWGYWRMRKSRIFPY
ncbi:spermatogenesis-associated protein 16 [Falco naumanni]|uniref:spermatogenesis-associated protein 16 n=1 Tax=Falco naumanni TaxID=148594 RepID=UPI001ADE1CA7|nr:spermatogenesis-associated protein 16 [Falco naumanni]